MIITRRIAIRLTVVILLTVILQAAFFSQLSILGSSPNFVPVVVVCLGLLGGGVVGAVCGFVTGFLLDSLLLQALGVSSLVLLSIGYLAGRYRERFEITESWMPPALTGGFTLLGLAGFAVLQLMLGVESTVSLLVVREIIVQSLLAVLLAFVTYPLIRRLLAPALIDYSPTATRRMRMPGFLRDRLVKRRGPSSRPKARTRPGAAPVVATHAPDRVRRGGAARRRTATTRGEVA